MLDLRKTESICVPVKQAEFPNPFQTGLEYGAPARGTWNIVHVGMLIPQSHQVFVCAQGCLRGVVLTAAEMGAGNRFSTVSVDEENLLNGDFEASMIDGVSDILSRMEKRPRALLLFSSCIHHFSACDLQMVLDTLRARFPDVDFTDCYMTPTLRKTISPDALMRRQLYSLLKPLPLEENRVNFIGGALSIHPESEIYAMLAGGGYRVGQITACKTYDDYLDLARARWNISMIPSAIPAGAALKERLGATHLHMPLRHDLDGIENDERMLAEKLRLPLPDFALCKERVLHAFEKARAEIGDAAIAIDYTATVRPLGLARFLLAQGFFVRDVFLDAIAPEEKDDLSWLRENAGDLLLHPTVHPSMRVIARKGDPKTLAIGQKAAYFTAMPYFVNLVEGGGLFGFQGMCALAREMQSAFAQKKDTRAIIQVKGWGCCG